MNLTDINEIKALLNRNGFRFSKALGQNFLCASWVPERAAEEAGIDGDTGVLEIGPGIGCLTVELSRRAKKVLSVEIDEDLKPVLEETLRGCENVEVLFGDVLKRNIQELVRESFPDCAKAVVCANLPYNITTPVLTVLVRSGCFETITVMLQKEVAERICARENTAEYGAFTVLMQWHTRAEKCFDVPPSCFIPAPKVTSSVIRLTRREKPPAETGDEDLMFALVRAAFNQRRKTLCNAMIHGLGLSREQALRALSSCGLEERVRGETLSVSRFAALADAVGKVKIEKTEK